MRKDFRLAGTGGQGVISLAMIMANAYGIYEGKEVTQTQSYGAEARGGACQAALIVSDEKIGYMKVDDADIAVKMPDPSGDHGEHHCRCTVCLSSRTGRDNHLRPGHRVCQLATYRGTAAL